MVEICWRHGGQRLVIPVAVFPSAIADDPHRMEVVEALIDTGATGTGLRPDVAQRLSVPGRGRRRVMTANGDIIVPEYRIRLGFYTGSFEAEAQALPNQMPYVLELGLLVHALRDHFSYAMLIGMDVLSQCGLTLRRDHTVTLIVP